MKTVLLAIGAAAVLAMPALAQTPAAETMAPAAPAGPAHAESGLPFCSAKVTDRCIQRSDLRREGKSTATKAPAA